MNGTWHRGPNDGAERDTDDNPAKEIAHRQ
jgi:hypothetical protein